jgi:CubicO group peptidase (beta-lactamase class C family)
MSGDESTDSPSNGLMNRRQWLGAATATLAATTLVGLFRSESGAAAAATSAQVSPSLQRFIQDYMSAMNAPGLTLGLANREGTLATASYGYADLAAKTPVTTKQLFQIGSISKSFAALVILQLQDEGKLDVQAPVLHYLPWLPIETEYGEILIHHLLTHSSGMPDDPPLFSGEPGARVRQTFKRAARHAQYGRRDHQQFAAAHCAELPAALRGPTIPAAWRARSRRSDEFPAGIRQHRRAAFGYDALHADAVELRGRPLRPLGLQGGFHRILDTAYRG